MCGVKGERCAFMNARARLRRPLDTAGRPALSRPSITSSSDVDGEPQTRSREVTHVPPHRIPPPRPLPRPAPSATTFLEELTAGVAELTSSDRWQHFLDVQARFHHYSFLNTLAILVQRPDATRVAGFHAWRQLGRHVRKGEKGIAILAPIVRRIRVQDEDGEEHVLVGAPSAFRLVHVFDVAQTDGEELPSVCDRLEGDDPGDRVHPPRRRGALARLHRRGGLPARRDERRLHASASAVSASR